ncbi:MAG: nuclear transport factor 2 family protein [Burkholderiales bacterium]
MNSGRPIEELLTQLEQRLLQPDIRKSEVVSRLLAETFVEFGSSGQVFTKSEVMDALHRESSVHFTASQFHVRLLAPHVALVTYRVFRHSEPALSTLRSSVWKQNEGHWQMVFHQGTPEADQP